MSIDPLEPLSYHLFQGWSGIWAECNESRALSTKNHYSSTYWTRHRKLTRYSTIIRPGRLLPGRLMDFLEGEEKYAGNIIQDQEVPHP